MKNSFSKDTVTGLWNFTDCLHDIVCYKIRGPWIRSRPKSICSSRPVIPVACSPSIWKLPAW